MSIYFTEKVFIEKNKNKKYIIAKSIGTIILTSLKFKSELLLLLYFYLITFIYNNSAKKFLFKDYVIFNIKIRYKNLYSIFCIHLIPLNTTLNKINYIINK